MSKDECATNLSNLKVLIEMQKHHSTDNDIMIFLEDLKFVLNGALLEVQTFYQNRKNDPMHWIIER